MAVLVAALFSTACSGCLESGPPAGARTDAGVADAGRADGGPLPREVDAADWEKRVLYFAMTDRFSDGDPTNQALGPPRCSDPADPKMFQGGDLAGLRARLDYLTELGVTALWITPVYRQVPRHYDACGYHGYWPDLAAPDDGEIEPRIGTEVDLLDLAVAAREKGIGLVADMIVNHAGYGARLLKQKPDWFHAAQGCEQLGDPELFCPLAGLPDLAQERAEVADYLDALSTSWVARFPFAGVRMDTARHVPGEYFQRRWIPALDAARPGLFLIAEAFLVGTAADLRPWLEVGFDSAFHFPLWRRLIETFARGGSVDPLASEVEATLDVFGQERARRLVTFLDNHDVPRFLTEMGPLPMDEARRRYHLALVALFTLPGIPQLYQGDELGAFGGEPLNRRMMPAWAWTEAGRSGVHDGYLDDPQRTFALVRKLARLRRDVPALHRGVLAELWRQNGSGPNLYVFFRGCEGSRAVVAFNNSARPTGPVVIPVRQNGGIPRQDRDALADGTVLRDALGEGAPATVRLDGGALILDLPARTAAVYLP